jgi:hypothetical protein
VNTLSVARTLRAGYLYSPGCRETLVLGNSEGYKGRKGPGCREPRRKGKLGFASQGGVPCPAYSTVTMTLNNKAVKGCGWLPFVVTEMQRRDVSGYSVSGIRGSRKPSSYRIKERRRGFTSYQVIITRTAPGDGRDRAHARGWR